jgi:hypothetical protein
LLNFFGSDFSRFRLNIESGFDQNDNTRCNSIVILIMEGIMTQSLNNCLTFLLLIAAAGLFLSGCEDTGLTATDAQDIPHASVETIEPANIQLLNINRELASLRRATAPFHNFKKADEAGYKERITPCWYHNELGAMGYHYANLEFLNGSVNLLEPEALMYEPNSNGQLNLVGLEYIVPIEAWEGEEEPMLLGQKFHTNEGLGLYTLHIWLWRQNPAGMFADWNPKVSCKHAEESEDRAGA